MHGRRSTAELTGLPPFRLTSPERKAFGSSAPRMYPYGPFEPQGTTPASSRSHSAIRSSSPGIGRSPQVKGAQYYCLASSHSAFYRT